MSFLWRSIPVIALGLVALGSAGVGGRGVEGKDVGQGWSVTHRAAGGAVGVRSASAAFALGVGEAVHPGVEPSAWTSEYAGAIEILHAGDYRFGVEVEGGDASLAILGAGGGMLGACDVRSAGSARTDWVSLSPGDVGVRVGFRSRGEGRRRLRTVWEMAFEGQDGFRAEPVPASVVRVPAPGVGDGSFEGRVLLERKGCTNCHDPGVAGLAAVGRRPGPDLRRIGERMRPDWLASWISEPQAVLPGADMPDLFGDGPGEEEAVLDVVHFLVGGVVGSQAAPTGRAGNGRDLYHRIGCAACHGARVPPSELYGDPFLPDEIPAAAPPRPLGDVGAKWRGDALMGFLLDPTEVHPDGRMPSLALSNTEARDLAAYLIGEPPEEPGFVPDPVRAARGHDVFAERGCGACHEAAGGPFAGQDVAIFGDAARTGSGSTDLFHASFPRYSLSESERSLLLSGIESVTVAPGAPAPLDEARRTIELLGCRACHALDGVGGPDEELDLYFLSLDEETDLGDEGRHAPDLSGAGLRLTTSWLRDVLLGVERARPYVATRMPRYAPARVEHLPAAFAKLHGIWPDTDVPEPEATDELVLAGRGLMDRTQLSCVACHVYKDFPSYGTTGLDMTRFAERVRYEWYRSFVWNPMRYNPGTRMPSFANEGRSTLTTVFDGDLQRQADALWAYFTLGEFMPAPDGVSSARRLLVTVGDRPLVLRTFLENAGSRGIAVGFPVGVHFGFDAHAVRLVEVWKGEFLDASAAWAGRGGQVAGGRGPVVWNAPGGMPLRIGPFGEDWGEATGIEAGYRFKGYGLDAGGVPTFAYLVGDVRVDERWTPHIAPIEGFLRRFELRGLGEREVWLRAGTGAIRLVSVEGAVAMQTTGANGIHLFGFLPEEGAQRVAFTVEVTP